MRYFIAILGLMCILLTACQSGPSPQEQIYVHLEQAVKLETEFENQQDPIVVLEQQEKELYDQIINLGLKEMEQIKLLSAEALVLVEERKSRLEKEFVSIKQSKVEFDKTIELVEQMEEGQSKEIAKKVLNKMNNRYQAYEELYLFYSKSITLDTELYNMFGREDLKLEELEEKIDMINQSYEKVIAANETFNNLTTEYNKLKKDFYETAGIPINYEKE